ncbi:MAG: molybdenum cofactor guanylyltransferase [Candidatus Bathyarchaeota archaeon]
MKLKVDTENFAPIMEDCSAIVLAGGESKRLNFRPKAFIKIDKTPLISHTVKKCSDFKEILVVVHSQEQVETLEKILPPSVNCIMDEDAKIKGPLIGCFSGFRKAKSKYSVLLACDLPFLNVDALKILLNKCRNKNASIPIWSNGQIEPLHSVYRTTAALKASNDIVRKGKRDLHSMASLLKEVVYVPTETFRKVDRDLLTFLNINTMEDLKYMTEIFANKIKNTGIYSNF